MVGVIVEVLARHHEFLLRDFYNRFALVNRLSKSDVGGENQNMLEDHLAMFETVLRSHYFT